MKDKTMIFFWKKPVSVVSTPRAPARIMRVTRRVKISDELKLENADITGELRRSRETMERHRLI